MNVYTIVLYLPFTLSVNSLPTAYYEIYISGKTKFRGHIFVTI